MIYPLHEVHEMNTLWRGCGHLPVCSTSETTECIVMKFYLLLSTLKVVLSNQVEVFWVVTP